MRAFSVSTGKVLRATGGDGEEIMGGYTVADVLPV